MRLIISQCQKIEDTISVSSEILPIRKYCLFGLMETPEFFLDTFFFLLQQQQKTIISVSFKGAG